MKKFISAIGDTVLIVGIWCACVALVGFVAGVTYGVGRPFFNMGVALLGGT